jgi:hypothetical protein
VPLCDVCTELHISEIADEILAERPSHNDGSRP